MIYGLVNKMAKLCDAFSIFIILFCIACSAGCTDVLKYANLYDAKPVYHIGVNAEFPPMSYVDTDTSLRGFDIESAQWIGEEMGFEVVFVPLLWKNLLPMLASQGVDMVYTGMTITRERAEQVSFSNPYLIIDQSVATHINSGLTMKEFSEGNGKIGVQQGTAGEKWVVDNLIEKEKLSLSQLVHYDSFPSAAYALSEKKLDFIICDTIATRDSIVDLPVHIIGNIKTSEAYGIAVQKGDVELLNTVNEGLIRLMDSPKWQELLEKYQLTPYALSPPISI